MVPRAISMRTIRRELELSPVGVVTEWPPSLMEAGMSQVKTDQIAVRLPADLLARLEAYAAHVTEHAGGLATVTRADVIRVLLARFLDNLETELAEDKAHDGR